jgi:hypothetical protein
VCEREREPLQTKWNHAILKSVHLHCVESLWYILLSVLIGGNVRLYMYMHFVMGTYMPQIANTRYTLQKHSHLSKQLLG